MIILKLPFFSAREQINYITSAVIGYPFTVRQNGGRYLVHLKLLVSLLLFHRLYVLFQSIVLSFLVLNINSQSFNLLIYQRHSFFFREHLVFNMQIVTIRTELTIPSYTETQTMSYQWVCEICDKGEHECHCDEDAGFFEDGDTPWICEICELSEHECRCDDYFEEPYPDISPLSVSSPRPKVCTFFLEGTCGYGALCRNTHAIPVQEQYGSQKNGNYREPKVCVYYQQGNCKFGANCYDLHIENEVLSKKKRWFW